MDHFEIEWVVVCTDGVLVGWWDAEEDARAWANDHKDEAGENYYLESIVRVN